MFTASGFVRFQLPHSSRSVHHSSSSATVPALSQVRHNSSSITAPSQLQLRHSSITTLALSQLHHNSVSDSYTASRCHCRNSFSLCVGMSVSWIVSSFAILHWQVHQRLILWFNHSCIFLGYVYFPSRDRPKITINYCFILFFSVPDGGTPFS